MRNVIYSIKLTADVKFRRLDDRMADGRFT